MKQLTNQQARDMLQALDDQYLALYRKINDPQRPPEPFSRIGRLYRPADLGKPPRRLRARLHWL